MLHLGHAYMHVHYQFVEMIFNHIFVEQVALKFFAYTFVSGLIADAYFGKTSKVKK